VTVTWTEPDTAVASVADVQVIVTLLALAQVPGRPVHA
jgi:hypothetical protein